MMAVQKAKGLTAPIRRIQAPAVGLPIERKEVVCTLDGYSLLLYGQPKIGKTSVLSTFPDTLFLSTEPGAKGLSIFEYNTENGGCTTWQNLLDAVQLLEQTDRFKFVAIDTVDLAYELCAKHVCKRLGIAALGQDTLGRPDRGASWNENRKEFRALLDRVTASRRGLLMTSHAKDVEVRGQFNDTYTVITPTMSGQARSIIEPLADGVLYCDYVQTEGKEKRVFITSGSSLIWAGCRAPAKFPRFVPMSATEGYTILDKAFRGEMEDLQIDRIRSTHASSNAIDGYVKQAKREQRSQNS